MREVDHLAPADENRFIGGALTVIVCSCGGKRHLELRYKYQAAIQPSTYTSLITSTSSTVIVDATCYSSNESPVKA